MDIDIQRAAADDSVELAVRGRLDAESAGELRQAVAAEVRRGMHLITLDLNGVSFLSSAGIRVLFETQREARGAGGDCHVRSASGPVRKVLELTRLDRILMRPAGDATGLPRAAQAATSNRFARMRVGASLGALTRAACGLSACNCHRLSRSLGESSVRRLSFRAGRNGMIC